jgi:hypothetical protein
MTRSRTAHSNLRTLRPALLAVLTSLATNSCGTPSPALQPEPPRAAPQSTSEPPPPSTPIPSECDMPTTSMRIRVDAGQTIPTGTGLSITNEGASHDNFGPGGFDVLVSLLFQRGTEEVRRMPSFRDSRPHQALGHCYRLIDADLGAVLLEVAALPPPPQDATPPTLQGVGGSPSPDAAPCTVVYERGPEGGTSTSRGCESHEICVCEAQAGYSCRGRCMPSAPAAPKTEAQ